MDTKATHVTCPCCGTLLKVDPDKLGQSERHRNHEQSANDARRRGHRNVEPATRSPDSEAEHQSEDLAHFASPG